MRKLNKIKITKLKTIYLNNCKCSPGCPLRAHPTADRRSQWTAGRVWGGPGARCPGSFPPLRTAWRALRTGWTPSRSGLWSCEPSGVCYFFFFWAGPVCPLPLVIRWATRLLWTMLCFDYSLFYISSIDFLLDHQEKILIDNITIPAQGFGRASHQVVLFFGCPYLHMVGATLLLWTMICFDYSLLYIFGIDFILDQVKI